MLRGQAADLAVRVGFSLGSVAASAALIVWACSALSASGSGFDLGLNCTQYAICWLW